MGFRLRALRLRADTAEGVYGADLQMLDGLNVLAAPNTAGKSTCMQAILFALGLEGMLGPAREVPLPHAMTQYLEDDAGEEHPVLQSQVLLEIEDGEGQPLTIRRYPSHADIDDQLVSVWTEPLSEIDGGSPIDRQDFYVRRPGAAQREAGFHHFLAERLQWALPEVPRFRGGPAPLYLETLAPLWFVEQKRGWSGIQAQTPTYLGIRDVRRRALEYTLDLDVQERARRIEELLGMQRDLTADWRESVGAIEAHASELGVAVEGLPSSPTSEWPLEVGPRLQCPTDDGWIAFGEELESARAELAELERTDVPTAGAAQSAEEEQLGEMHQELDHVRMLSAETARDLELEEGTARDAMARLEAIEEDIRRHHDLLTLARLGSDVAAAIVQDDCPTCHKRLEGVLLAPEDAPDVLAVDASVELLQKRRSLLMSLVNDSERVVAAKRARITALQRSARDLRSSIRAVRDSLISASNTPSVATIEERLAMRRRVQALDALRDAWIVVLDRLDHLANQWRQVVSELKELRDSEFSEDDREKLTALERVFQRHLDDYGFRSCPVDQVALAFDDYMPTHEGFELSLDFSASDGIRVIWAYLLGLLEVAGQKPTNHPGVVVFDEPRQQAAEEVSFSALFARAADVTSTYGQVLFATSEGQDSLAEMLGDNDSNLMRYSSKILQPMER